MDSEVEQLLSQARSLGANFLECSETRYIEAAIVLDREALKICAPGHPRRSDCLIQLSSHVWTRYNQLGGMENIDEAIALDKEALLLRPPGHPDRSTSFSNLAADFYTRYEQFGRVEDLEEAIRLDREALELRPQGHPLRSSSLNNLAKYLFARYNDFGTMEDVHEAVSLDREALALHPPEHQDRSTSLNNLAADLYTRYEQFGIVEDLEEAVVLNREALTLRPPGHILRASSLSNLASYLCARYNLLGQMEDLNAAIVLDREALALRPPGHPLRSSSLNGLAGDLHIRYSQFGGMDDLEEAIYLNRETLELCSLGHPLRPLSLNNLAVYLCGRYNLLGTQEDLDEAITFDREVLALHPAGHPDRPTALNNLAANLIIRHKRLDNAADLEEAIYLDKEALELRPHDHPLRPSSLNNLANHICVRYDYHGTLEDLNLAIELDREAFLLRPPGHPDRSVSLDNLASHLYTRYKQLAEAADKEEMFRLYTKLENGAQSVSSNDLSAAKAWVNAAEHLYHPTTLLAYETAFRLLVRHLAFLPSLPQHLGILKNLTSSLAVDAFSAFLRKNSPTRAVELLEQGRGVFWNQLIRLRSPMDDVVVSGGKTLAEEFIRLTFLIRNALNSPGIDQHASVFRLNAELQSVVSNIRKLPGFSRFLLPSLFSDLQRAASAGPVIIVNASQFSCDALIVFVDRDPVHIPLAITRMEVQQLSSKLHASTVRAMRSDVTREFAILFRELWDKVVSPIVDILLTTHPRQTRIWWCPTAEFSSLPLHAANPYRKGQRSLADFYISSYTPTLNSLIRARRPSSSEFGSEKKRFVAIGPANAAGLPPLHATLSELNNVEESIEGLATFTYIEGQESCVSRVIEELQKNQWVHITCHGIPNRKQPFESAFALQDGHLTIQKIIQCDLRDPEFAYLSACHTTVGDDESPDEAIHLAAAMQFVGFRSVIGTMWAVSDAEASEITSVFYKYMVDESGRLDHTRAAYALWRTMKSVKIPLDQRVLYIHIGA